MNTGINPGTTDPHAVLIAGAGPSGLTLAIELTRRGIACTVFDKAPGPAPLHESRALAFNSRSQSILSASGVTRRIRAAAHRVDQVQLCWQGRLRNEISLTPDKHHLNELLIIRQGQIERELLGHLREQGVQVHWNTALSGFNENNNAITASLTDESDQTQQIQGRYLVGCDGARSYVRKNGGYSYDGESDPQIWTLADVTVKDQRFAHTLTADLRPGEAFATMPIESNLVRLIHNGPDLLERHPFAPLRTDIHWQSEFRVSYRLVKRYHRGLTFLCGDAAHIHSPVGGRGMNLGIEDAATLAWLLEQGTEAEYTSLRRPVAQQVLKLTHNQTTQMNATSRVSSFLKQYGPALVSIPAMRRRFLKSLHGLDTPTPQWLR